MSKILSHLYAFFDQACRCLIFLMTILVIISVFLRYVLGITFIWAEEAITMLFIASSFYGAVLCVHEDEHIRIEFVYEKFSPKVRKIMNIIIDFVILFVEFYMTKLSLFWISKVGNVLTNGMRVPIKYFYSMIPISCTIICIYCVISIIVRIYSLITNKQIVEGM
ncbi:MAG: TRAP transporter small permease [Pleomorphochaeta sp.]